MDVECGEGVQPEPSTDSQQQPSRVLAMRCELVRNSVEFPVLASEMLTYLLRERASRSSTDETQQITSDVRATISDTED